MLKKQKDMNSLHSQEHAEKILTFYSSHSVVTEYGEKRYITACERLLFDTYIKPGMDILDIGVGGGRTSEYLAGNASRYVGIDFAPEMVTICRRKYPQWEYFIGSATDLSAFADSSFDAAVLSYNILDDLVPDENRWSCLKECHRVLREDGVLIFSSHNPRAVLGRPNWKAAKIRVATVLAEAGIKWPAVTAEARKLRIYAKEVFSAIKISAAMIRLYATQKPFWAGQGYMLDGEGLMTHFCTPVKVNTELEKFGFRFMAMQGDDYPLKSKLAFTEWYYYVFLKTNWPINA